jgi:hypothetical protein
MRTIELKPAEFGLVLAMNNAAVPNVNHAEPDEMSELIGMASVPVALADDDDDTVLGFVLALPPGVNYGSENYRWFSERYDSFAYVDRIVVADGARGRGIGVELYRAVTDYAVEHGIPRVLCEVNLDPPNPGSLRFHKRIGFEEVGQQRTKNGTYLVSLLAKEL